MKTNLVLTATVQPRSDAPNLARTDVADRIEDYCRAFAFYCPMIAAGLFHKVVVIDNSGYGLGFLDDIARDGGIADRVELISYDGLEAEPGSTRFFGETSLLRHGFATSAGLREEASITWKVTGRYIVRNIARIVTQADRKADLIVHCRNHPVRFVDFGIAGFSGRRALDVFDRILAVPGIAGKDEAVIRALMDEGVFDDMVISPRLPRIPDFHGVRGSDNARYEGWPYRAKFSMRSMANVLFPSLWI